MKTKDNYKSEPEDLRQKAEKELLIRGFIGDITEIDHIKLIHDLQVHQIELEMQNEELILAKEKAELASEKYVDLYDFAPFGYLTISEDGTITDLNFSAARILGKDRIHLKTTRFVLYVCGDSLESFNLLLTNAFEFNKKETCELILLSKTGEPIYVHVDALVSQNAKLCLITMIDITERKKIEIELQKALHQYKELNSYFLGREMRMIELKKEINELLIKSCCEKEYLI